MRTITGSERDSSLIVNKDVLDIEIGARRRASSEDHRMEGAMPVAYVFLGAVAFPLVLATALASGMHLLLSGLVALTLSGPLALVVYLALALATTKNA